MRPTMNRLVRKTIDLSEKIVLQVVVSVAATVCVAAISNAYLKQDAASTGAGPTATESLAPQAAASLLNANFTADSFRPQVASPAEFAAVFGLTASAALSGQEWPVAEARADENSGSKIRLAALAGCADECGKFSPHAVLPPVRPVIETSIQAAQASQETAEERRLHLLGIPLPHFVPSGDRIVTAVASLGGSLTDLVLK
ncbi:hypothetical protein [Microvirga rosea]|uniref:hypothetical protein n=1 Tax=Microvirga rosea TaxID=2715425 RepID=UPI001D0B8FEF|nr:hypothetical protein [Microvirga rosea]MCB8822632.1 hypothetical protein [Microvirga rosea]